MAKYPAGSHPPAPNGQMPPRCSIFTRTTRGCGADPIRRISGLKRHPAIAPEAAARIAKGSSARDPQVKLLGFCVVVMAGSVPKTALSPVWSRTRRFQRKDGGLRPIAVGLTLRRLVVKIACAGVRDRAAALLSPIQVGYGVRGGSEAAVHCARRFLASAPKGSGIVKLDFAVFNSVIRRTVIVEVQEIFPGLSV